MESLDNSRGGKHGSKAWGRESRFFGSADAPFHHLRGHPPVSDHASHQGVPSRLPFVAFCPLLLGFPALHALSRPPRRRGEGSRLLFCECLPLRPLRVPVSFDAGSSLLTNGSPPHPRIMRIWALAIASLSGRGLLLISLEGAPMKALPRMYMRGVFR